MAQMDMCSKGAIPPKWVFQREQMMRHQMLVVFPTCSYNPQEVPEQTKNNISNVLQNYHIKAEAVGMFHHVFTIFLKTKTYIHKVCFFFAWF
jgi:ribosome-binding factor A